MNRRRWLGDLAGLCLEAIASLGREVFGKGSVHLPRTPSRTPAQKPPTLPDLSSASSELAAGARGEGMLDAKDAERIC